MITFKYTDKDEEIHVLELADPDWITDYTKIHNVTVRRAMSGKLRTYVVRDRKYAHAITYSMRFVLHRAEVAKTKKFMDLCEGHYVWTRGIDSDVGAQVKETVSQGGRTIKLINVSGSINVGDYAAISGLCYTIVGVSDTGMTVHPGITHAVYAGESVTIYKQQMVIITNQQFDYGSEARAAGDENDPDDSGHLIDVDDETYTLTLAILVIKT
jgi:hypothetical protein